MCRHEWRRGTDGTRHRQVHARKGNETVPPMPSAHHPVLFCRRGILVDRRQAFPRTLSRAGPQDPRRCMDPRSVGTMSNHAIPNRRLRHAGRRTPIRSVRTEAKKNRPTWKRSIIPFHTIDDRGTGMYIIPAERERVSRGGGFSLVAIREGPRTVGPSRCSSAADSPGFVRGALASPQRPADLHLRSRVWKSASPAPPTKRSPPLHRQICERKRTAQTRPGRTTIAVLRGSS